MTTIGRFKSNNGGKKNGKKAIGLGWQKNNLARALRLSVHFLAVVARFVE